MEESEEITVKVLRVDNDTQNAALAGRGEPPGIELAPPGEELAVEVDLHRAHVTARAAQARGERKGDVPHCVRRGRE